MSFSEQDVQEFKAESLELLDQAEKSLLALDQGAEFGPAFDAVFRAFHNIKGASGMMELPKLEAHTHELESLFMKFKETGSISKEYINLFLRGIDASRALLDGQDPQFRLEIAPITAVPKEVITPTQSQALLPDTALNEFALECSEMVERLSRDLQVIETGKYTKDTIDTFFRDVHSLKGSAYLFSFTLLGDVAHGMESSLEKVRNETHLPSKDLLDLLFKGIQCIEALVQGIKTQRAEPDLAETVTQLSKLLAKTSERLEKAESELVIPPPSTEPGVAAGKERDPESAGSIRVPTSLLDNLMTLMGEMVLVRNQVLQFSNKSEDPEFLSMSKRLNVVTSEIQGEMMKTRMQPLGNVIGKFNRVVRDLSQELNKNIILNTVGSETELDKSLLEAIKDPLTHIVRNSCDHGIETPEVRRKSGKPDSGTILIKAYHEGGQVVIEVSDDGKGLHKEVLVKKAIEKGLLTQPQAAKLSDKEIYHLIFAPGFSTAAKITNVSGRGVGMDVVRTNIERIGGTIDLSSTQGSGTSIKIKIPLTLAIVPALIVKCSQDTFAIPQVKLEELVRVDPASNSGNRIEYLHETPVYRLRGNILPLVDLNHILKKSKSESNSDERRDDDRRNYDQEIVNIAVLNAEQSSFGLIIDEVQDTADIVVKPINRLLKSLQIYSGATILGDGSVALILDILGLSKVAQIARENQNANKSALSSKDAMKKSADLQDFLLVQLNTPTKHAIPLSYVNRLEEFKTTDVEFSGPKRVIRYRDVILPLVTANEHLGYPNDTHSRETIPVVVIMRDGTLYGVEVNEILDTLSTEVELDSSLVANPCMFGNLNTKDELIVVVDPFEMISRAHPDTIHSLKTKTSKGGSKPATHRKVLLVEDTAFFRKAIRIVLEKSGFEVHAANDGQEAIDILNQPENEFEIVISDIEMPRVNGFQLATAIRKHPTRSRIPLLAVSSRADREYRAQGEKAGFDMYLEKLKPTILLAAIEELTGKERGVA